ncbi:MAG: 4Fe-4S binding protein [candidate division WOR-3 bacterium]|nr:MAG: 4Fe-4S binding protein [candidate division WOR-3 bacterium]
MKKFLRHQATCTSSPKGHGFTIIRDFCKGCRICVEFCPSGALGLDDRFKVTVVHPEKCIACRMCEYRCPDLAIYVRKSAVKVKDG